jgi:hypothetical protein
MRYINFICCSLLCFGLLTGCAWFSSGKSSKPSSSGKVKLPRVKSLNPPGGIGKTWRYLGTSDDGQLVVEINDSSIHMTESPIYTYQDRKTVVSPSGFTSYMAGQPHYKYLISNWQVNCEHEQYIILNTTLYNESAVKLLSSDYTKDSNVKWIKVGSGSLAALQYDYVCQNKNRNLGY